MPASPVVRVAELSLLGVAFMFGLTFVLTQEAIERLPVTVFLAYRFLPAAVLVGLLCHRDLRRLPRAGWRAGLVVGCLLAAGNLFQAMALKHTSASTAGLITGLFVVATPLLGWALLGTATSRATWIAAAGCVAGLALLSGRGGGTLLGNGLALLAALTFGGHILALGTLGRRHPPGPMATLQLAVCGVVFLAAAPLSGGLVVPALTGWLVAGDRISPTGWLGAAMMLSAVFYVASRSDVQAAQPNGPHSGHSPPTSAA